MNINVSKTNVILFLILIISFLLRIPKLGIYPPALYTDEADQGYNAYSLLKTGRDEHGVLLPVSLRSFGDWKPPLQTYLMLPFIRILGLNEISVRLPSAIVGVLSVYLSYLLVCQVFGKARGEKIALLTSVFVAISPWHIHQSRSAMLVMVSLFTMQAGTVCFILGSRRSLFWIIAAIMLALATYSYYGMRLIIPLWSVVLIIYFRHQIKKKLPIFLLATVTGIIILTPLITAFLKEPNVVFGRARTVSIFYDRGVTLKLWELTTEDQSRNTILTRFFHNKFNHYAAEISKRYLSHFDGEFLFLSGDKALPFYIPGMGVLYFIDSLFLYFGFYIIMTKSSRKRLLIWWILLSILPAALTFQTPSHNRTFPAVFAFCSFAALGLVSVLSISQRFKLLIISIVTLLYTGNISYYLWQYYRVLPLNFADQWSYGLKEIVNFSNQPDNQSKTIIVLPKTNVAYIYFLFYDRFDPSTFLNTVSRDLTLDEFGFEHVKSFDRFISLRSGSFDEATKLDDNSIIFGRAEEIPDQFITNKIVYPDGRIAFVVHTR